MRIWFDLSNSPHINFFYALICELEIDHEIDITCRPLANTIDLLRLYNLPHKVVGKHYGAKFMSKVYGYPVRVQQLYHYLKKNKPDVAISHSSFHSPLVSRLLGCRSIYLNDNEHALGNIPAFLAANTIMIPEFLDKERVRKQGATRTKLIQYPGVKEGIYLWNLNKLIANPSNEHKENEKAVYIRPEPWMAQYYSSDLNFMDSLIRGLKDKLRVILLPRGDAQAAHYRKTEFSGLTILDKPMSLPEIAFSCRLFIGAGGTMTREMAVLGIPTISVYQDELLDVDSYLISIGQMIHKPNLEAEYVLEYLEENTRTSPRDELLKKGEEAYKLIKAELLNDAN